MCVTPHKRMSKKTRILKHFDHGEKIVQITKTKIASQKISNLQEKKTTKIGKNDKKLTKRQ